MNRSYFDYTASVSNTTYEFCQSSVVTVPVQLKNRADVENRIYVDFTASTFATLDSASIVLPPHGTGTVNLTVDFDEVELGSYSFRIMTESDIQDIRKELDFNVDLIRCHGIDFDTDDIFINYTDAEFSVTLDHIATIPAEYFFWFEGPEWMTVADGLDDTSGTYGKMMLDASESRDIIFNLSQTNETPAGTYKVKLFTELADGSGIMYADMVDVRLSEKRSMFWWLSEAWGIFLLLVLIYIIILLIAFIVIALVRSSKGKKREKGQKTLKELEDVVIIKEKREAKKEAKEIIKDKKSKVLDLDDGRGSREEKEEGGFRRYVRENKSKVIKIILIIIIIALILAGLFWVYHAFFNGAVASDGGNETVQNGSGSGIIPAVDGNDTMIGGDQDSVVDSGTASDQDVPDELDNVSDGTGLGAWLKGLGSDIWDFIYPAVEFCFVYKWYIITAIVLLLAILLILWLLKQRGFFVRKTDKEKAEALEKRQKAREEKAAYKEEKRKLKNELRIERLRLKQQKAIDRERVKEEEQRLRNQIAAAKRKEQKEAEKARASLKREESMERIVESHDRNWAWVWLLLLLLLLIAVLAGMYYYGEDGFRKFIPETDNISGMEEDQTDIDEMNNITKDYGIDGTGTEVDSGTDTQTSDDDGSSVEDDENATPVIIDIIPEDVTEVIVTNETVIEGPTQEEIDALEGPIMTLEKDTITTFDLNEIFADPDGDALRFSVSKIDNVTSELDQATGIVTLIPQEDWTGITGVWFTADDGKGGIVTTDRINIVVVPQADHNAEDDVPATGIKGNLAKFVSDYLYYIIVGLIILVIIILITRYNKHLVEFFDDDDPDAIIEKIDKDIEQQNKEEKKTPTKKKAAKKTVKKAPKKR